MTAERSGQGSRDEGGRAQDMRPRGGARHRSLALTVPLLCVAAMCATCKSNPAGIIQSQDGGEARAVVENLSSQRVTLSLYYSPPVQIHVVTPCIAVAFSASDSLKLTVTDAVTNTSASFNVPFSPGATWQVVVPVEGPPSIVASSSATCPL